MKKLLSAMLVMFCAFMPTSAHAAFNNWGNTDTMPLLSKNLPGYLLHGGVSFGGATSMTTTDLAVPLSYAYVRKALSPTVGAAGTLANGTPGQYITIFITSVSGSGTYVLTPTTKTGFTSVTFTTAKQQATFLYLDDTNGWIMVSHSGSPTVTIP